MMRDQPILDGLDRCILNAIQDGLPIVAEPFAGLADSLGIEVEELLERIARLRAVHCDESVCFRQVVSVKIIHELRLNCLVHHGDRYP